MYKLVNINDIIIPDSFKNNKPKDEKLNKHRAYYKTYGRLKKNIVLNNENVLKDGYCSYLVLLENGCDGLIRISTNVHDYRNEVTKYVFGVHPGQDKEFCWRVPHKYIDSNINVGQEIMVATRYGKYKAIVTRVEVTDVCPVDTPVRRVLHADSY